MPVFSPKAISYLIRPDCLKFTDPPFYSLGMLRDQRQNSATYCWRRKGDLAIKNCPSVLKMLMDHSEKRF